MPIVLVILAAVAFLFGAYVAYFATGAIHEILAGVSFLIFSVFLVGFAIVESTDRMTDTLKRALDSEHSSGQSRK